MTEAEWNLKKENTALRKQVAQLLFNAADAEDKALGSTWLPPAAVPVGPSIQVPVDAPI
jgi:hypothetical protein